MRPILDRHFRTVLNHAPDGVLVESRDAVAYVNAAYARLLGYEKPEDLCSVTIRDIAHPDDCERLLFFGRCRAEGKPAPTRYTFRACARGGTVVTLDASISAARCDGELLITTIVRELHPDARPMLELPGTKHLSPREREVVQYLLEGKRSKEIALLLDVSEKTIWTHRSRAFQKLALRGVGDLFRVAMETGAI
ncbi:MAG TPA: LuxR C-terminal-related transcriptional regulator [Thermoanaerobaculia bacterium]|jgi:PAS domain S-box-containing protein|nr:LuxR C-terminal-related transcriptional regulator [Thermoanaerobaculia bacterium]